MNTFQDYQFRATVDEALSTVRKILDTTKHPARAADVPHVYDDKYGLVEQASKVALVATANAMEVFGASGAALDGMRNWVKANKVRKEKLFLSLNRSERTSTSNHSHKSVSIQLVAEERCKFVKKVVREEESKTKHVTEWSDGDKRTYKTVTTIEEWIWTFTVEYKLVGYCGADPDKRVVLQGRTGSVEIVTTSDKSPRPEVRVVDPIDVNITWLLRDAAAFKIDRAAKSCRTPRRNGDVEAALSAFEALHGWCARVASYFQSSVFSAQALDKLDMGAINGSGVFVPFVPLMLPPTGAQKSGALLPAQDQEAFIGEQKRSLEAKLTALGKAFADEKKLVTGAEAMLLSAAAHVQQIAVRYSHCVDYVEFMLEQQLVAAVGKVLQPKDFGEYMQFHARRLFAPAFAPKPFVYAIRRPDHCPEGLLTIDSDASDGALEQPLQSIVSVSHAKAPMFFSLGAATRAALLGERYLHGAILHQFSHQSDAQLRLTARARQFSSFVLLVGKIASADTFEPTHATIVQNKDDVLIPLLLEQIPSAKAFRDAIESLSPEQQRFAKAFRAMQLESTLFAVAVVEIKPQLERLLKLNADALTKEIRLTQDLMELFIEYQVPSDLLAYDGAENRDVAHKIAEVKRNVQAVQDMIKAAKQKELDEEKQKAEFERASRVVELVYESDESQYKERKREKSNKYEKESKEEVAPVRHKKSAPKPMPSLSSAPAAPVTATTTESAEAPKDDAPKEPGVPGKDDFVDEEAAIDYTQVPAAIDAKFDELDEDGAVRPTKVAPGDVWRKKFLKSLLAKPSETSLGKDELRTEKNKAFDLLDALSKSGALALGNCQLHVVIVVTHCFDRMVMETVTRDNVNPIEKVERTQLIIASAVHAEDDVSKLVRDNQLARVKEFNSNLF
jgi:hypothetical protein